jgi:hemoglobin
MTFATARPTLLRRLALVLLPLAFSACAALRPATTAAPTASLYSRLGGYDAIAAVTDDFLGRALADPRIVPYFKGLEPRDLQRVRQHVVDQLCNATGGPCFYPGKDMKTAHEQFEINNDIWNAFTGHFNETFAKFKIPERERNELVVIVGSLRSSIVNR